MNRRVATCVAVIGLLVMAGAPSAIAQTKNPCAAKGANPCAAKNPCAVKMANPCAGKYPMGGASVTGSKGAIGVYIPGHDTHVDRLKSIEAR